MICIKVSVVYILLLIAFINVQYAVIYYSLYLHGSDPTELIKCWPIKHHASCSCPEYSVYTCKQVQKLL